jgi:KTSC domain
MNRENVSSSNIVSIGYDESSSTLEVEFVGGQIYEYFDVPASVHADLMSAGSHGSFLSAHIRGSYRYQRI